MNTAAAHPVSPEEIMALLDGELAPAEAQRVSTHLDHCTQCAGVAQQFRAASQLFARWTVEEFPSATEAKIQTAANASASVHKLDKPSKSRAPVTRGWRPWIFAGSSALAAAFLLVAFTNQSSQIERERLMAPKATYESSAAAPAPMPSMMISAGAAPTPPRPSPSAPMNDARSRVGKAAARADELKSVDGNMAGTQSGSQNGPMIARTVALVLQVKEFNTSRSTLEAILARHHGYSSDLTVSTPENASRSMQASLRIPVSELAAALADFRSLGRVENETQSGEEVTQQHADLVERLKTAHDTEDRFRELLRQRTGNVADLLEVEEGIARVRGEIESMEAQLKGLEHRVDFATIDLQLSEEYKPTLNSPSNSFGSRMRGALINSYRNASGVLLGLLFFVVEFGPAILIVLAIFALPAFLLIRRYRRISAQIS